MSRRAICIHGHFYQPPRENPWIEAIERQESARPYRDWNERITAECYGPNAAARILDDEGRITRIVDNYRRISFNVGPTLLAWMEAKAPETYAAILAADDASAERFGGHGSGLAQVYNHAILPLSNVRDRRTQIRWGIADFRHRFGRDPEGMWMPETAVDTDTLEAAAAEGIAFTVLAPRQAEAVRPDGEKAWTDVSDGTVDTTRPYAVRLPSGRSIAVFFYDGALSREVAFERLLDDGEAFAARLLERFEENGDGPRLVHVATDGETYGHHHHHGEMALAFALGRIAREEDVRLTNYAEWLALHPPEHEARIVEASSWSCVHGVERWRADCGCSTGSRPGWTQAWREPLRAALDRLRDDLVPRYEKAAARLLADPWAARDAYVEVILDRSPENLERWFAEHAVRELDSDERVRALELLELQRHAMLMYTSCGWFFADLAGIETVQVIQYAGRAVQLARKVFDGGEAIEEAFLEELDRAESNDPARGTGRDIYHAAVEPAEVDLRKVAAHWAVSSMFEPVEERQRVYCYTVERLHDRRLETGRARLALGEARITSVITRESTVAGYGVLHMGDHNVVGGVHEHHDPAAHERLLDEMAEEFERADFPAVIRRLDDHFSASAYSLRSLFHDEQRRVVRRILDSSVSRAADQLGRIYEDRAPLMRFVADLGIPAPRPFRIAAEFVINRGIRTALVEGEADLEAAGRWIEEAVRENVELDEVELAFAARQALERRAGRWLDAPESEERLESLAAAVAFVEALPFDVPLWRTQNAYWRVLRETYPGLRRSAAASEEAARWVERFEALGARLSVAVEALTPVEERR